MEISLLKKFVTIATATILIAQCTPQDRPVDVQAIKLILGGIEPQSPQVIYSRKINLDKEPDLEVLFLIRNGQEEHVGIFKGISGEWRIVWKKSFSLLNIGPIRHAQMENKWIPHAHPDKNEGYVVKNILAAELPGDKFNSLFMEVLSEEPPLGLFSVPMGFRLGQKILDGFALLKDHPKLVLSKRGDFDYKPEDKTIRIFPRDVSQSLEMVFNGSEMIPNLSSQPIPALTNAKKEGNRFRLEFKNRGGYSPVTYLTLSFPQGGKVRPISSSGLRVYQKGDSIYSRTLGKNVPATYPLIEATKEGWGTNVRYAFEFEYEPTGTSDQTNNPSKNPEIEERPYFLFRTSYRYNRQVESIPNDFSVTYTTPDQQGFPAYRLPLAELVEDETKASQP